MSLDVTEIYVLRGKRTEFAYRPATQRLEIRGDDGSRGRALAAREEKLSIGTAATAVLEVIADGPTTTLTLLLPRVNFLGEFEQAPVTAVAITTVAQSSIGGPSLVDGPIESYQVEQLAGTARRRAKGPHDVGSRDWAARFLRSANGEGVVLVTGTCTVRGHTADLRRHEPQGAKPSDLLLDLLDEAPGGAPNVLTDIPVRYEERTRAGFRTVTILPDGLTIPVH
jgi:hypothetical protein